MIKRKSPITVAEVMFCNLDPDEADCTVFADQFIYDKRHDFYIDSKFSGIAAKITLDREPSEKGIRRSLSINLVDTTSRYQVASQQIKVSMSKDQYFKDIYVCFTSDSVELKAGNSYKLTICDESTSETIGIDSIHLFGAEHGNPEKWYAVNDGCIKPSWEDNFYKSLRTINYHDYYVRFNINQNFGDKLPEILPELEIRLYYPDGNRVDVRFMEPRCEDFDSNSYFVQIRLISTEDITGVFYAELLCMQYVMAGFVFATDIDNDRGCWFGPDIEPLDEYTLYAAKDRLRKLLPNVHIPDSWAEDLDKALDQFIGTQKEDFGSVDHISENESDNEEAETPESSEHNDMEYAPEIIPIELSLDKLTGLTEVKRKLNVYERLVRFNKMRRDFGLSTLDVPLHAMFLGSPGTGKTTVAKRMGFMLKKAGVLSKGHVVVRERATLLGMYYSSEGENTLKALEEAKGGILFIDEAYQLYQPNDPKDPGKFVIETLLSALADDSNRDWMLILAGYPEEMMQMFEMNPGFKSRIPESNIYQFEDFTSSELMEIAENYLSRHNYELSDDAKKTLNDRLNADYAHRNKNFGNARHVMNLIQTEILPAMAVRVTDADCIDNHQLMLIQASDIPEATVIRKKNDRPKIGYRA